MNLDLEDEDSLSERFTRQDKAAAIDIAVVRLPRISNFTDFIIINGVHKITLPQLAVSSTPSSHLGAQPNHCPPPPLLTLQPVT